MATTRASYDATAEVYAQLVGAEVSAATEAPLDRALLAAFVEVAGRGPARRVADVGCGPGRVAAFLAAHGIQVVGVDVSPAMLAVARDAHPDIQFAEGRLTALPVPDRSLAGAVCWYSVIHTPSEQLQGVCAELGRVLAPGGQLLMAFQAGNGEKVHRTEVYGTEVSLTSYRHAPRRGRPVPHRGRVRGAGPSRARTGARPRVDAAGLRPRPHRRPWQVAALDHRGQLASLGPG